MKAAVYIDRGRPFLCTVERTLSDGSKVWDILQRDGDIIHCVDEKRCDAAFILFVKAIEIAAGERPLVL